MDIKDTCKIIAGSTWFKGVPEDAILNLALAANIKKYKKKSILYKVDDVINEIYLVLSGKVRVSLSSTLGHQFDLNDFGEGKWVGEAGLISNEPQIMDLQFKEESEILSINCDLVHHIGQQHPIIYYNVLKEHDFRTRGTYQILKAILFNPLKSRLAGRILYIIKDLDIADDGSAYLDIKISQAEFAGLTHGSRQHINKIFKKWNENGIIMIKDHRYFIPSVDKLKQEAYLMEE